MKAVEITEDEIVVQNHIVLWGDPDNRDLEGVFSNRKNADGSIGEYFTPDTILDSDFTAKNAVYIDWEHGQDSDAETPDRNDILGYVDWKSAQITDEGLLVNRILNRHHSYVKFLEKWGFFKNGWLATSSEPVQSLVEKGIDGQIKSWPLYRDALTVTPMEYRMYTNENMLAEAKSLGISINVLENEIKSSSDNLQDLEQIILIDLINLELEGL